MEQNTLTLEQALQNLALVAASYRGTAQEHDVLRQSVQVLADAIKLKPSA
ncbi:MAG: hypothetical protein ACO3B7_04185 [Candidatus Limnocylindrus sp.]|jgi:hypothetical protein